MERIISIAFRINGELSGSFANAIAAAQRQMQELNRRMSADAQRNMSRAARAEQNLMRLYATREAINQYKNLNQSIGQNAAALMQSRLRAAQLNREYQDNQRQTEQMRQSYERLKEVYRENRSSMSEEQRTTMQEQIRAAREELRTQESRTRESGRRAGSQGQETSRLENSLAQQRQRLEELRASLTSAGVNLSELSAHERELEESIRRTTQELERQRNIDAVRQRHSEAGANFGNAYDNLQNSISTAQTIMSPFADAVKTSMQFNKMMSEVQAVTGATGAEFDALKAKAQELGASTMFSASESAEAMKFLGMAGFQVNDILGSMPAMLSLAAAGNTDLARTADILSDGLTAFKMQANEIDSTRFADVMAATVTKSNTSVELMGETFKYAGAVAGSLGYSIEDVALATGLMANASVKGSMAGTALRSTFTRLVSPPKDAAAALEALGVTAVNADGTMKPFRQTLLDLRAGFKNLTAAEKAEYAAKIAGLEAQAGFLAMVDATDESFNSLMSNIDNSQGMAGKMSFVQSDNLEGAVKTFESAFEGIQIAVGDAFEEPLKNFVNSLATGLQSLTQWVSKNQELVVIAGQVAAAISGIIVAIAGFGAVSTGIEYVAASFQMLKIRVMESVTALRAMSFASITSQISSMATSLASVGRAAMGFVFSPIGAVLMAIALAGYYCYTHWSQVAPVFQSLASTLGGSLQGAITAISSSFESLGTSVSRLGPAFSQIGGVIFGALAVGLNAVVNIASTIISTFANAIAAVMSLFGGLGNAIASALAGDWDKAAEYFKNALVNAGKFVVESFKSLFGGIFDTFSNFFKPLELMGVMEGANKSSGGGSFGTPQPPQQVDNSAVKELGAEIKSALTENNNSNLETLLGQSNAQLAQILQTANLESQESAKVSAQELAQNLSQSLKESNGESIKVLGEVSKSGMAEAAAKFSEALKSANLESQESAKVSAQELAQTLGASLQEANAGTMAALQTAFQAQAEQKNLEVEPLQTAVAQTADTMSQFAPTMAQAADGAMQMTAGQQTFNAEVQNSQATISATNAQLQASQGALSGFNAALSSTNGGLASLASSSSSAASAISGLGSAASSAVSALQSAGANAAAAVSAAAANVGKPAANFQGGIYSKGAFLTTFAEKSPEAAIPIDNSKRAADLWTKTGQLLGLLPGNSIAIESAPSEQKVSTIERVQRQRFEQVRTQYEAAKNSIAIESARNFPISERVLGKPTFTPQNSIAIESPRQLSIAERFSGKSTFPPRNLEVPRSIFGGRVQTPEIFRTTQTQARSYENLNIGGDFLSEITQNLPAETGGILPQMINNLSQPETSTPIDLHFEINIAGNASAEEVEAGIRQTIPLLEETFESKIASWRHEQQRRSF